MITVSYKPNFIRQFKKLSAKTKANVYTAISLFQNEKNHAKLKAHKLHGHLAHLYSFSVQFDMRIVFYYQSKKEVVFVDIGSHAVYR